MKKLAYLLTTLIAVTFCLTGCLVPGGTNATPEGTIYAPGSTLHLIVEQDSEHFKELDSEFHGIIFKACGNRVLCKTLSDLHRNIHFYRKQSLAAGDRLEKALSEHKQILAAIETGDCDMADRLTSDHIEAALKNLLTVTEN